MIKGFFNESIVKKAQEKKLVEIEIINLRDFAVDKYKSVDDRPYGGGAGMIMRIDIIYSALSKFKVESSKLKVQKILTSPKGKRFDQQTAVRYSKLKHLIIIAGHYEGVDQRVMNHIDEEVSIGDFIMTGGEIAAAAIVDSIVRLLPGVLKKEPATVIESFFKVKLDNLIQAVGEDKYLKALREKGIKLVQLLEYPQYTRPEKFMGIKVPKVLLSGNHKEIDKWRLRMAYKETLKKRKDLLYPSK